MESVRIGGIVDFPFVSECFIEHPQNCAHPGFDIEFIYTIISDMLRLKVIFKQYERYDLLESALDKGDIDIIGVAYPYSTNFSSKWNYSLLFHEGTFGFVVKSVKSASVQQTAAFSIFSWQLWLVLLSITMTVYQLRKYSKKLLKTKFIGYKTVNLVYAFWFVIVGVIIECYGNLVTVDLILPDDQVKAPFDNLTDLGEMLITKKCRLAIIEKYKDAYDMRSLFFIPEHNKSWAKLFEKAFLINPPLYSSDRISFIEYIKNGTCIVGIDYTVDLQSFLYDTVCGIHVKVFPYEIPFSKYLYYHKIPEMNRIINGIMAANGLMVYYKFASSHYKIFEGRCHVDQPLIVNELSFNSIRAPLYIFGTGVSMSILSMITVSSFRKLKMLKKDMSIYKYSVNP